MYRLPAERGALLTLVLAAALAGSAPAGAQSAAAPTVLDLTLPVTELEYTSSSLDDSLQSEESGRGVRLTLAADVLFSFNKASLTSRARSRLDEVAERIERAKPRRVAVEGYTDSKGSDSYNRGLSERRADAVTRELRRRLGGSAPTLRPTGRGEADPVAANEVDGKDNPRGRAKNRRVTVSFGR